MSNHTETPSTRRPAFASANEWPTQLLTPAQARALEFPWEVKSSPLMATETFRAVDTHKVHYRSDTEQAIGVVGSGYGVVSNDQFVEFAEATGLMVSAAGIRNGGSQVWMQLNVEGMFLPTVDPHARSVWMANAHDGSGSMIIRPCFTRISCMNQWTQLRKNHRLGGEVTLRHTAHAERRFEPIRHAIAAAYDQFASMEEDIHRMLDTDAGATKLRSVVSTISGDRPTDEGRKQTNWDNRLGEIQGIYNGETCRPIKDTDYGILMAVNEWELNRGKNPDSAGRVIAGLPYTTRAAKVLLG